MGIVRLMGIAVTGLFWPWMWLSGGLGQSGGGGGQADDLVPGGESNAHLVSISTRGESVAAGPEVR